MQNLDAFFVSVCLYFFVKKNRTTIDYLAASVRRAHDVGKSGWYMLIPFYNFYLLVKNGDEGSNQYGPDPKNPTEEISSLGTE
ncbi:MAG: hypothetical protein C4K58_05200 [Flavobacteriaceae bacterium]|nr:MAG: hypothetical protein C4K58_05200 [Flavobacteriaceae bacterium]